MRTRNHGRLAVCQGGVVQDNRLRHDRLQGIAIVVVAQCQEDRNTGRAQWFQELLQHRIVRLLAV